MATDSILRPGELKDILLKEIDAADLANIDVAEVGSILEVKDGIARIWGLGSAMAGSLVIQMYDRTTGSLIWESHATDTLSSPNPDKIQKAIDKAVSQSFKKYPPKQKKK